jgi:hypothetical protein
MVRVYDQPSQRRGRLITSVPSVQNSTTSQAMMSHFFVCTICHWRSSFVGSQISSSSRKASQSAPAC